MADRFAERISDREVAHDVRLLADFVSLWCDGHHRDRARQAATTGGAALGVYGRRPRVLCGECTAHLAYAEKRRAFCPKAPKPFCAYCDTHCYRVEEREWQKVMMRYSGPRSWRRGHAIDGIKHLLEARRHRAERRLRSTDAVRGTKETP
jgi:hypothetical protein